MRRLVSKSVYAKKDKKGPSSANQGFYEAGRACFVNQRWLGVWTDALVSDSLAYIYWGSLWGLRICAALWQTSTLACICCKSDLNKTKKMLQDVGIAEQQITGKQDRGDSINTVQYTAQTYMSLTCKDMGCIVNSFMLSTLSCFPVLLSLHLILFLVFNHESCTFLLWHSRQLTWRWDFCITSGHCSRGGLIAHAVITATAVLNAFYQSLAGALLLGSVMAW